MGVGAGFRARISFSWGSGSRLRGDDLAEFWEFHTYATTIIEVFLHNTCKVWYCVYFVLLARGVLIASYPHYCSTGSFVVLLLTALLLMLPGLVTPAATASTELSQAYAYHPKAKIHKDVIRVFKPSTPNPRRCGSWIRVHCRL